MIVVKRRYKQFTSIEEEVISRSISKGLTILEITAAMPHRSIQSIRRKLYSMGLASPPIMKLDSHFRRFPATQEKHQPQSVRGDKSDRWQSALTLVGARLIEIGGIKTYCIDGVPVSIFKIMRIYNSFNLEDKFPI